MAEFDPEDRYHLRKLQMDVALLAGFDLTDLRPEISSGWWRIVWCKNHSNLANGSNCRASFVCPLFAHVQGHNQLLMGPASRSSDFFKDIDVHAGASGNHVRGQVVQAVEPDHFGRAALLDADA